jgi:hypothetical protein
VRNDYTKWPLKCNFSFLKVTLNAEINVIACNLSFLKILHWMFCEQCCNVSMFCVLHTLVWSDCSVLNYCSFYTHANCFRSPFALILLFLCWELFEKIKSALELNINSKRHSTRSNISRSVYKRIKMRNSSTVK